MPKKGYVVSPGEDGWEVEARRANRASHRFGTKVRCRPAWQGIRKGQIEETMDTLSEEPEGLHRSYPDR